MDYAYNVAPIFLVPALGPVVAENDRRDVGHTTLLLIQANALLHGRSPAFAIARYGYADYPRCRIGIANMQTGLCGTGSASHDDVVRLPVAALRSCLLGRLDERPRPCKGATASPHI